MKTYSHVLAYIREHPWAVLPSVLATMHEIITLRMQGNELDADTIQARLVDAAATNGSRRGGQASGDVAVLPLYGLLLPRYDLMAAMSGATTMEGFRADLRAALADPDVATIVLDVDSPGGVMDMIPETAALLRRARAQKPIVAVANTMAGSAAYYLASQADEIVASPSSLVGSIGVYTVHEDWSGAYEQAGVTPTLVKAGRFKAEGSEYAPLTDEARAHIQESVDAAYEMFLDDVARGRGVKKADVRSGYGEGRALRADAAKEAGLVDRIEELDETIARVMKRPPRSRDGSRAIGATETLAIEDETESPTVEEIEAGIRFAFEKELLERRAVRR